jgi:hypothetical protein
LHGQQPLEAKAEDKAEEQSRQAEEADLWLAEVAEIGHFCSYAQGLRQRGTR